MLHQMNLRAAGDLRREFEANAEMCGTTPKRLIESAPLTMTIIGHRERTWPDGRVAIRQGDLTAACATDDNVEQFRTSSGIRIHPGITPGDLGGIPVGDLILRVGVADRLLRKASQLFGTRDPWETCGFLIWSFNRLLNSVREDFPAGTIGVASQQAADFIPVYGPHPDDPAAEWVFYTEGAGPRQVDVPSRAPLSP